MEPQEPNKWPTTLQPQHDRCRDEMRWQVGRGPQATARARRASRVGGGRAGGKSGAAKASLGHPFHMLRSSRGHARLKGGNVCLASRPATDHRGSAVSTSRQRVCFCCRDVRLSWAGVSDFLFCCSVCDSTLQRALTGRELSCTLGLAHNMSRLEKELLGDVQERKVNQSARLRVSLLHLLSFSRSVPLPCVLI